MASAAIQLIRPDAGPASDDIIKRVYAAEYSANKHGAKSRTARLCNCTPPHVTNVLRRHGIEEVKPKAPEFNVSAFDKVPQYTPPPDAYPEPVKPILCQPVTETTPVELKQEVAFETVETVAVPHISDVQTTPFQTIDACFGDLSVVPISNNYRRTADDDFLYSLAIALLMTAGFVLVAPKSILLGVPLGVLTLFVWWCVIGTARHARYWSRGPGLIE